MTNFGLKREKELLDKNIQKLRMLSIVKKKSKLNGIMMEL